MDLEFISKLKVQELKDFLRLRGLKVNGKKEELVARVFVAAENDVPLVQTAEEVQAEIAREYRAKLSIGVESLPDPFTLVTGWLPEDESLKMWPTTLYPDIYNFLSFHPIDLKSKDLSDYKTSKGYSYYVTGWLSPLDFHPVSESSKLCILKATCRPSQKINDVPHKLWVCICKEDGQIFKAHCTCMAGVSQTCNHIAAALFRIEAAVRMGLTNVSCTAKSCEWLPNNKLVKAVKIKDLKLSRSDFGRRGKKKAELNCSPKKRFDPTVNITKPLKLEEVADALRLVFKESESIIFTAIPKASANNSTPITEEKQICTLDDFLLASSTPDEFCLNMEYFPQHIALIEKETRGQSNNLLWFAVRQHMITASKAHDVKTRMCSFRKGKAKGKIVSLASVFEKISGIKKINPLIPALRYGRAMEDEAANTFMKLFAETHTNVSVEECGIFLCSDMPFVGGSPDRIISCDCCGKACLEVKCPFSISHLSPSHADAKLPYLKRDMNLKLSLSKNHKYFTQCQVQMSASKLNISYFFVWTAHGYFVEKLEFDTKFWKDLKELFMEFYLEHYVASLFS